MKLQDRPLQILHILVERPGLIVTREELRPKIWPSDPFVDFDPGMNNTIKRLTGRAERLGGEVALHRDGFSTWLPLHRNDRNTPYGQVQSWQWLKRWIGPAAGLG